jgi:hypothetical protein
MLPATTQPAQSERETIVRRIPVKASGGKRSRGVIPLPTPITPTAATTVPKECSCNCYGKHYKQSQKSAVITDRKTMAVCGTAVANTAQNRSTWQTTLRPARCDEWRFMEAMDLIALPSFAPSGVSAVDCAE